MNVKTKILTSTAVAIALTGGIGATLALADTPTPTPSPSTTSTPTTGQKEATKDGKKHKSLEARGLHGEVTLGGKKHQVVTFQRGTVEQINATSVTVKSKDGFTATYALTAQTKVRKAKATTTVSEVKDAEMVRIVARKDGSKLTAKIIRERG